MMIRNSNIRRSLVQNRYKILVGIIAIILVLYIIQTLNKSLYENAIANTSTENTTNQTADSSQTSKKETVIYGSNISNQDQTAYSNTIDQFIQACNAHQNEKAYNLLTKECQEVLYNSQIALFEKNYINRIFSTKKTYSIQSWMNKKNVTYQVKIAEDMLATGMTNTKTIEEYYTVIKEEQDYKLNINSYIGREEMNQQKEENGILILVTHKDIYREYEEYQIEIQNVTQNTILMDSKESTSSVYLYGDNEASYPANLYEVDDSKLIIKPNEKKEIKVTFNKRYSTTTNISYMVWEDVILNQEEYEQSSNKKEYTKRTSISVSL